MTMMSTIFKSFLVILLLVMSVCLPLYLMTMKSSDYLARYVLLVLPIICSAVNYSHPSTPSIIVNIIIRIIAVVDAIIIVIVVVIQSFSQHHHWPIIRSTVNHSLPNVWGYRTHQSYFLRKEKISRRNSHLFIETLSLQLGQLHGCER